MLKLPSSSRLRRDETASERKNWPAESKLVAKRVVRTCRSAFAKASVFAKATTRQVGATVFAPPPATSEDWSLALSLPFCHLRLFFSKNGSRKR